MLGQDFGHNIRHGKCAQNSVQKCVQNRAQNRVQNRVQNFGHADGKALCMVTYFSSFSGKFQIRMSLTPYASAASSVSNSRDSIGLNHFPPVFREIIGGQL